MYALATLVVPDAREITVPIPADRRLTLISIGSRVTSRESFPTRKPWVPRPAAMPFLT
jgi:hypothetical protein